MSDKNDNTEWITQQNHSGAMTAKRDKFDTESIGFLIDLVEEKQDDSVVHRQPTKDEIIEGVLVFQITNKTSEANAKKAAFANAALKKVLALGRHIILDGFPAAAKLELRQSGNVFEMFGAAEEYYHIKGDLSTYQFHKREYEKLEFGKTDAMSDYLSNVLVLSQQIKDSGHGAVSPLDLQLKVCGDVKKKYPDLHKNLISKIKEEQGKTPSQLPTWSWLRGACMLSETEAKTEVDDADEYSDDGEVNVTVAKLVERGVKAALSTMKASGGTCNYCGKGNHKEHECWKKNPALIPEWALEQRRARKK